MDSNGMVIGIVTDLEDPEKLGRVKVKFPHLNDQESEWARLATLMAGRERGSFFRPEVGDEVLVTFLLGDIRFPIIIGSLWNSIDKPPQDDGRVKENNWRFIKSRSGHVLKFDDTAKNEKIEITSKSGHTILLDDTKDKETIEITAKDKRHTILIDSKQNILQIISHDGDVEVKAPKGTFKVDAKTIELKAKTAVNIEAGSSLDLKAKAALNAQGQSVAAKAQATMNLQADAMMDIKASGPVNVKGALINLN